MRYYNGDIQDSTNFSSQSYLHVNSCGIQSCHNGEQVSFRQNGRVDYHIIYLISGTMEVTYDARSYLLKPGGFVLYPPNTPHKYRDYPDTHRVWVHFSGQAVPEMLREACLHGGVVQSLPSNQLESLFLQLIMAHNCASDIPLEKGILASLLYQLGQQGQSHPEGTQLLDKCAVYLVAHYNTAVPVSVLAELCGLSQSRFLCLFKERFGMPPKEYQTRLRIRSCAAMLTATHLPISDIGRSAGYEDPLYFSRIFKKHTGLSPRAYRQQHNSSSF